MKAELKRKWVEALRSGKYKQGKHFLRKGDCFCCLGVLCDVAGQEWKEHPDSVFSCPVGMRTLDNSFSEEIGLPTEIRDNLADMNDGYEQHGLIGKYDFDSIAKWIENYVPVS